MRVIEILTAALAFVTLQASPAVSMSSTTPSSEITLTIAGWVENGWIGTPPIKVKVKLDTGAKTSSINAPQYRDYERDGVRWVSFTLINNDGNEIKIDVPVVRMVTILRAGVEKRGRPVIKLNICVAGVTQEVEFTMADRSELKYPILIGRSFLEEKILVDSARTFLASGLCQKQ